MGLPHNAGGDPVSRGDVWGGATAGLVEKTNRLLEPLSCIVPFLLQLWDGEGLSFSLQGLLDALPGCGLEELHGLAVFLAHDGALVSVDFL